MDGGRCFVMELNRSRIVPPKTLFDMINKINSGFYDVDTQVVRENYRVVTPPLEKSDEDEYGMYITSECTSFPMYRLERMTSAGECFPSNENVFFSMTVTHSLFDFALSDT